MSGERPLRPFATATGYASASDSPLNRAVEVKQDRRNAVGLPENQLFRRNPPLTQAQQSSQKASRPPIANPISEAPATMADAMIFAE